MRSQRLVTVILGALLYVCMYVRMTENCQVFNGLHVHLQ